MYLRWTGGLKYGYAFLLIGIGCFIALGQATEPDSSIWFFGLLGLYFLYCGVARIFYSLFAKRSYSKSEVNGERYAAIVDENGVDVAGDDRRWQFSWSAIEFRAESDRVFVLYAPTVIFIFAKRFLTPEQQVELRDLSKLPAA